MREEPRGSEAAGKKKNCFIFDVNVRGKLLGICNSRLEKGSRHLRPEIFLASRWIGFRRIRPGTRSGPPSVTCSPFRGDKGYSRATLAVDLEAALESGFQKGKCFISFVPKVGITPFYVSSVDIRYYIRYYVYVASHGR